MPILGIIASSFRSGAGPTGAYDSLATVTVPSGGLASITFAGIPTGYKHLELRSIARSLTDGSTADVGFEGFINSDTSANYSRHSIVGDGSTAYANGFASRTYLNLGACAGSSTPSNTFAASIALFLDYASTNKNKTIKSLTGLEMNNTNSAMYLHSSAWYSTSAMTSLKISTGGSFAPYSQFALYGVK